MPWWGIEDRSMKLFYSSLVLWANEYRWLKAAVSPKITPSVCDDIPWVPCTTFRQTTLPFGDCPLSRTFYYMVNSKHWVYLGRGLANLLSFRSFLGLVSFAYFLGTVRQPPTTLSSRSYTKELIPSCFWGDTGTIWICRKLQLFK